MKDFKFMINGEITSLSTAEKIMVENPFNNEIIGSVPKGTKEDAQAALKAAQAAFDDWKRLPAQTRAGYLYEMSQKLKDNRQELAELLTSEQGKILPEALGEIDVSCLFLEYAAENARRIEGEIISSENVNEQIWIQRVPYGVTVGLCAWNYPLALAARKIGNALVTGNTMVIKPPSETPLTVMRFAELITETSLPKGVLNFITGSGRVVGEELVSNKITKLVTLTGSTGAGRALYKSAAENITVLRLELGGKAPYIVMEDADLDKAINCAVVARFTNCGQVCTCNERMYIHSSVYDEFKAKYIEKVKQLKMGNPMEEGVNMGAKVNKSEIAKLEEIVQKSVASGAKVLLGGKAPKEGEFAKGNWFEPTVLEVTDNSNEVMQEETFGPIAAMMKFDTFEEVMKLANECDYGLSSYLFTSNIKYIMDMVKELEFGEVYVNRENGELVNGFHNGYKLSGVGGEDGKYGLEGYLQKKTIYLNHNIK